MPATLPPGIGNDQQATQATAFVRQQPWYLAWLKSQGIAPGSDQQVKLSDSQRDQLRDLIVSKGVGLNNKYDGIDENGQIVEEHHKLRNGLIAAAIGGAAATGLGAAGIGPLSGLFGGGAAAAEAGGLEASSLAAEGGTLGGLYGGAGAVLPSTAIGSGFIPAVGSTSSLGSMYGAAAPVASSVAKGVGGKVAGTVAGQPNIWSTIINGAGNLFGAWNSSNAAQDAAKLQSDAITHAADLQAQAAKDSLAFQNKTWEAQQAAQAPWLKTGQGAITTLGQLMGLGGGTPSASAPAVAPQTTNQVPQAVRPPVNGSSNLSSIYGTNAAPPAPSQQAAPASNYVRIKWPDGSQDTVNRGSVPQYQLLGAEVSA